MRTAITVLLHAGFILFSVIFFASAVVTWLTWQKVNQNQRANKVWLSKQWLMVLGLGFGVPWLTLGGVLLKQGESTLVLLTGAVSLALGVLLGVKAEERLRYEHFKS